jgi:hypothetical protein
MYNIYLVRGYKVYGLVFIEKAYEGEQLGIVTRVVEDEYKFQQGYSFDPKVDDILKIGETDEPMDRYGKKIYCGHIKAVDIRGVKTYINLVTWTRS